LIIEELERKHELRVYPRSLTELNGTTYFLARGRNGKMLGVAGNADDFSGTREGSVLLCPLTTANAATLRSRLCWLSPQPLGLKKAAGCGDRLGLATPGHVRAIQKVSGILPIFAQQSIRENERTGRTPQQVMDEAMWGVFQEGWRGPWGADADHLKTTQDVDSCLQAGFTFYTVDPRDHVDNDAHTEPVETLRGKFRALPWSELLDSADSMLARYVDQRFLIESFCLEFSEASVLRAACKYGRAIAHASKVFRHLSKAAAERPFELEVSVDEAETPTSPLEHFFIASELRRMGVEWVSLAPRYVGRFEKGVDYIGDLELLDTDFARHAAIARVMGPYKLSLHSGSDKFSVYPIAVRNAKNLVHLKTAGTSYLEALRVVADVAPDFFRQFLSLAHERYDEDKRTYHVSADSSKVPAADDLTDGQLAGLLDQFDARQMFHVTFGSALDLYGERLKAVLDSHEEDHYAALEKHFLRHLEPLTSQSG